MAGVKKKKLPVKNMDLLGFKFPSTAIVSIFHRVSGVILFISIPLLIYLFHLSLRDELGFSAVGSMMEITWVRLVSFLFVWSFAHHLLAGIRCLLLDLDIAIDKKGSQQTAWLVIIAALIALALYGVLLL